MNGSARPQRPPLDVALLLSGLAGLLWLYQFTTVAKFSVLKVDFRFPVLADFIAVTRHAVGLTGWDLLWTLLILAVSGWILVLEVRSGRLTRFFRWMLADESRTRWLLAASCLVWVRFYFASGQSSWVADTAVHNTYAWIASQAFAAGEVPIWTNYLCAGSPFLQFYGFVFFYAVALASLVSGNVFWSIKLVLAAAHVVSGLTMYLFVRSLTRSRRSGFLAGTAYVLSFWHTQQVLLMGRLPLSVFYALLPVPFYCLEQLRLRRAPRTWTVAAGLALAALTYTHPGYAYWATLLLAVYVGLRWRAGARRTAGPGLAAIALGVAFGAWLSVPLAVGTVGTGLAQGISMARVPDVVWQQLVSWSNYRVTPFGLPDGGQHWYGGYLGISLLLIVLCGLLLVRRAPRYRAHLVPIWSGLLVALVLVFGYRWPVLSGLPLYHAFNAGRYLLFVVFFLAAAAGTSAPLIARAVSRKSAAGRAFTALVLLVALDLGPTTLQHPYMPARASRHLITLPDALAPGKAVAPPGEIPGTRVLFNTNTRYQAVAIGWTLTTTGLPVPYGLYNESTPAWPEFVRPLGTWMDDLAHSGPDSLQAAVSDALPRVLMGAHLLNARHLMVVPEGTEPASYAKVAPAGPVLVSNQIVPASAMQDSVAEDPADRLDKLLTLMGTIDTQRRACDRFVVRGIPAPVDTETRPEVKVLAHRVQNQRVLLRIEASAACFARLAYAYYPYLAVTVDDRQVQPWETAGRFILLRVPEGIHDIVLQPFLSPLRRGLLAFELGLLLACAWFVYRERQARRPAPGPLPGP